MTRADGWLRIVMRFAPGVVLACVQPAVAADEGLTVDGYGRIDGRYCALAVRIVLDDGRRFEADTSLAPHTTLDIRSATLAPSQCGQAPRLAGGIAVVPARPAIELTLPARDWARHATDVDALMRRFPQARLRLRVIGPVAAETDAAVLHIATALLQQRPEVMARTSITVLDLAEARDTASGWRLAFDAFESERSVHADSAADVARLLAAAR